MSYGGGGGGGGSAGSLGSLYHGCNQCPVLSAALIEIDAVCRRRLNQGRMQEVHDLVTNALQTQTHGLTHNHTPFNALVAPFNVRFESQCAERIAN